MTFTSDRGNRDRRVELSRLTGLCSFCRPHRGCNRSRQAKYRCNPSRRLNRRGFV